MNSRPVPPSLPDTNGLHGVGNPAKFHGCAKKRKADEAQKWWGVDFTSGIWNPTFEVVAGESSKILHRAPNGQSGFRFAERSLRAKQEGARL
jgi:hypothetical protein